jgi:hypothetical protein
MMFSSCAELYHNLDGSGKPSGDPFYVKPPKKFVLRSASG